MFLLEGRCAHPLCRSRFYGGGIVTLEFYSLDDLIEHLEADHHHKLRKWRRCPACQRQIALRRFLVYRKDGQRVPQDERLLKLLR